MIEKPKLYATWKILSNDADRKENVICECIICGEKKSIYKYALRSGLYPLCQKCGYNSLIEMNINRINKFWNTDLNGPFNKHNVIVGKRKRFWFKCPNGHNFRKTIKNFCLVGCPSCNCETVTPFMANSNKTQKIFSFVRSNWNEELNGSKFYSPKTVNDKQYWFNCKHGHTFKCSTRELYNGKWCPSCEDNKRRALLIEYTKERLKRCHLENMVDFKLKAEYNCGKEMSFDIAIFCNGKTYLIDFIIDNLRKLRSLNGYKQLEHYAFLNEYKLKEKSFPKEDYYYLSIKEKTMDKAFTKIDDIIRDILLNKMN